MTRDEQLIKAALDMAAKAIDRRCDDYTHACGTHDYTTGVTEYPGNGSEFVEEWDECAAAIRAINPADVLARAGATDPLTAAAVSLRDALDGPRKDMHRMVLAACFGAERFDKMASAPISHDAAPMAMLRALLTAIIDPDDASLDDLRACNRPAYRHDTGMEHIARDIREGRFPKQSEQQKVMATPQPDPDPDAAARLMEAETPRAWRDVMGERIRQMAAEGWTTALDDLYVDGEMCAAAACYTLCGSGWERKMLSPMSMLWPWSKKWWKPTDRRRDLVKAGALILAEIERLDRAACKGVRDE